MENQNKFQKLFNFENIGTKIKSFTKWYCWISIVLVWVAAIICFFVGFTNDDLMFLTISAIFCAAILPFLIWISSWAMYAFGELVEKAASIDRKLSNNNGEVKSEAQMKIDNERIAKLKKLRADGFITEEEYQQALKNSQT